MGQKGFSAAGSLFSDRLLGSSTIWTRQLRVQPQLTDGDEEDPVVMQQRTSIRLQGCAKTFPDGTRALEPMTLDIEGGETVVFLGPSGCGKTTTLRIIAGLESPDAGGRIYFDEEDVTNLPIEHRNVGMVFQSYALFPNMNVEQNIAYGLKIRKISRLEISTRVNEMLDMMHIQEPQGTDHRSTVRRTKAACSAGAGHRRAA